MARKGAYQSQRTYATVLVLALRPTHTAWGSADIAPFRLDDWFGHSDSSLLFFPIYSASYAIQPDGVKRSVNITGR